MSEGFDFTDLLGKRFEQGARGPEAFDCWGLCEEIYRRLGRDCPSYITPHLHEIDDFAEAKKRNDFEPLLGPEPYCIVEIRVRNRFHAGVVMPDCRTFLHIMRGCRVARERLDSATWRHRIKGFYRWIS